MPWEPGGGQGPSGEQGSRDGQGLGDELLWSHDGRQGPSGEGQWSLGGPGQCDEQVPRDGRVPRDGLVPRDGPGSNDGRGCHA